jgi:hypothetical protein
MTITVHPGWLAAAVVGGALYWSVYDKKVVWEEEVLLNNGRTIIVKRRHDYALQGQPGNPFDIGWAPVSKQSIEFTYDGKEFRYWGHAELIMIAIGPNSQPALIARADDNSWGWRHKYPCTTPYYVQLVPTDQRGEWTWPPSPEPWLNGLRTNLMMAPPPLKARPRRYSAAEIAASINEHPFREGSLKRFDPAYVAEHCPSRSV